MANPGDATAGDVPARYDVVIDGKGYVFADTVEPSLPFRTHRAIYDISQTFVQRQNISNSYGDNAQDFFPTVRQRDFSLGEQQRYFRTGQDGRYWAGSNVDVSRPGQVMLAAAATSITFAENITSGSRGVATTSITVAGATNLYNGDHTGTFTSKGAHGLGAAPGPFGMCSDGHAVYLSTTGTGSVGVRKWDGSAFSTFSATPADALAFLNNTLYGLDATNQKLIQYDSSGTATTLFTWKASDGTASGILLSKIEPYGGDLLILLAFGPDVGGELWVYDGVGTKRLEVFPSNFAAYDVEVLYGVAYIGGEFFRAGGDALTQQGRPAILFYDGTIGKLWEADEWMTIRTGTAADQPALGVLDGRLVFTDDNDATLLSYDPALGGVSTTSSYTVAGQQQRLVTAGDFVVHLRGTTNAEFFPASTYASTGYVRSSLIDFESSLPKIFRGITVEWEAASDGDGGSVDIAYKLDGVTGSYTSLRTAAASGDEYTLPSSATGHALSVQITLNKGTSTTGPVVKSLTVRAAPQLRQFRSGTYILDCTGDPDNPRFLRDDTPHPLTGFAQTQNLLTTAKATSPFSVTDKFGTFTALIDLNDPEGFDIYEVHPTEDDPSKPGAYLARVKVREV